MQLNQKAPMPSPWNMMSPDEQVMFASELDLGAVPQAMLAEAETEAPMGELAAPLSKPVPRETTKTMQQTSAPAPMSQSDYDMLVGRLNEKGIESLKLQGEGIAKQEALLKNFQNKEPELDLTPIAGLLDQWIPGGNHLATTRRPMSRDEKEMMVQKLEQAIQQSREGLSQSELGLLRNQLGLEQAREDRQMRAAERDEDRALRREIAGQARPRAMGRLPGSVAQDYTKWQGAVNMAKELKGIIGSNAHLMGPVKGKAGVLNPYSEDQRVIIARFDGIKQVVGKMIEGGVLRAEDEVKYKRILPTIEDLPKVAQTKAEQLEKMLAEDLARYMDNFGKAGYDVSGFAADTAHYKEDAAKLAGGRKGTREPAGADKEALDWANANPKDPRAIQIKARLGVQ